MKKTVILLSLILLGSQAYSADYNSCKILFDDGKYTSAANCFYDRINSNPKDVQSHLWYAASLYYDKQYAKSYQQYNYIVQKFPNTSAADYAQKEAQKVKTRINNISTAKANDKGDYVSELDYTSKWMTMPIRVWIAPSKYSDSAKRAFSLWQSQTGNLVKFTFVSNKSVANIKVSFVDKITNPSYNDQVGQTNLKFSGKKNYSADIELLQRTKSNQMCSQRQIYYAALHEIGHAIGISGHSSSSNDLMYYNTNTNSLGLSNRDVNTVKRIYAK